MAFISGTLESLLLYNSSIHQSQREEPVYSQAGRDKPSCTQTGEQGNNLALSNKPTCTQTQQQEHSQVRYNKPAFTFIREQGHNQALCDKPAYTQTREQGHNQALCDKPAYTQTREQGHNKALCDKPVYTQTREQGHNQALCDKPAYTHRKQGHNQALCDKPAYTQTREQGHNQALCDKPAYTQTREQGHSQALCDKPAYTQTREQGHSQALCDKPAYTQTREPELDQTLQNKPVSTHTRELGQEQTLYNKPAYSQTREPGQNQALRNKPEYGQALYDKLTYIRSRERGYNRTLSNKPICTQSKEPGHNRTPYDKPAYIQKREQRHNQTSETKPTCTLTREPGHSQVMYDKLAYTQTREPSQSQTLHIKPTSTQTRELGHNQTFHNKPAYIQTGESGTNQVLHKKPAGILTREQGNSQSLFNQTGGSLYSTSQYGSPREPTSSHSNSNQSQRGKMPILKFRERANRVSTASSDQLCSTEEETWEPLDCMETDDDASVWATSPTMSTSAGVALSSRASDTGLSGAECSGSERRQLCSSSSLQDVIDADESGTEEFVTTQAENKNSSNQSPHRASTSTGLCDYSKARINLADLNVPSQSPEGRVSDSKMLNEQCFQAAISEGFGSASQTLTYKVRPMKKFSYHVHSNRLSGAKQMSMGHLTHLQNKCHWDQNSSQSRSFLNMSFSETLHSVKSTNSTYQHDSHDHLSSDSSSQNSKKDFFDKKYRYNHTALALQQSGLMKTTVKTAEILHRGKILQAEMNKLRKETAIFMRSVLSNPENQHFRDLYMKLHHSKNTN